MSIKDFWLSLGLVVFGGIAIAAVVIALATNTTPRRKPPAEGFSERRARIERTVNGTCRKAGGVLVARVSAIVGDGVEEYAVTCRDHRFHLVRSSATK